MVFGCAGFNGYSYQSGNTSIQTDIDEIEDGTPCYIIGLYNGICVYKYLNGALTKLYVASNSTNEVGVEIFEGYYTVDFVTYEGSFFRLTYADEYIGHGTIAAFYFPQYNDKILDDMFYDIECAGEYLYSSGASHDLEIGTDVADQYKILIAAKSNMFGVYDIALSYKSILLVNVEEDYLDDNGDSLRFGTALDGSLVAIR